VVVVVVVYRDAAVA